MGGARLGGLCAGFVFDFADVVWRAYEFSGGGGYCVSVWVEPAIGRSAKFELSELRALQRKNRRQDASATKP
jgi:hypothetical protein